MTVLTTAQRQRIEAAIRESEARTSAEFLCALARSSDTYFTAPLLIASAAALVLPIVFGILEPGWAAGVDRRAWFAALPTAAFGGLAISLTRPMIAARLAPRAVKARRAARFARATFLDFGLASVERRNGVLLFVSLAERHVEVIADSGVHAAVEPGAWQAVVDAFTAAVKRGDIADGYVAALSRLGDILAVTYPRAAGDTNEIPDRLVELD